MLQVTRTMLGDASDLTVLLRAATEEVRFLELDEDAELDPEDLAVANKIIDAAYFASAAFAHAEGRIRAFYGLTGAQRVRGVRPQPPARDVVGTRAKCLTGRRTGVRSRLRRSSRDSTADRAVPGGGPPS